MNLSIKNNVAMKIAAAAVAVGMAVALFSFVAQPAQAAALTETQIQSIISLLQSFGADQATINNVNASLHGQATGGTTGGSSGGACPALTRDLQVGSSGADVKALQVFLNSNVNTQVASAGAGSPGNESTYFGGLTKAAVMKFQAANNVAPIAGYVGKITRAAIAAVCGTSSSGGTGSTGGTGTAAGTVTVGASTQPANSLAPQGSSRVPFTNFTLTNTSNAAVTINSVTVQRGGLAQDAVFSGVELLDSNGVQVGISHTFNSNHQANIGDTFVLQPGQSMTYTVGGNMAASLASYAGQVAAISVVAINTSSTVTGSLPITGAANTINATLSIGSVSTSTSSFDPGATQAKNIGDTGVRFSGLRFTAGSTEDLKLYNIRWRNTGTASAGDFSNVVTVVNGVSFPATVDTTGKYYTSTFPGGLLITKGNSIDVYVQGDITGSNASSRSIKMDIDKVTDVYFVGQLYGYGIAPSGTYTPWFAGNTTNISGGSATAIQNATSVASANIPVNVPNTTLGGFQTNFRGEPVTVTQIVLTVATSGTGAGLLTNVSIVDENGAVVAGPVDASGAGTSLTFTDSVTFPLGVHTYTVKGKVPSGMTNGGTITLSTTPSSQWTSPTGQVTGNSVTLPSSVVTMNAQTIQAGSLTITASPNPVAASIVAGVVGQELGNIQLNASASGEDIRLSSLPVSIIVSATANATDLNTCLIYDGSTVLNANSPVNPSSSTTDTTNTTTAKNTFTFDNPVTVSKGTVKTLTVKCNIVSGASLTSVSIGVHTSNTYTSTGLQSGATITPTATTGASGSQTISSAGTLTATASSASVAQPSLSLVPAGTTGVTMGYVKFHASKEDINLTKVGLTLANGTYGTKSNGNGGSSNSGVSDVVTAYLYNGATLIGTATFTGTTQTATSTLISPVKVAKDTDLMITIKTDLAAIGVSAAGGIGDTVKVDPANAQATGAASGTTVNIAATAGVNGVQMFKSVPTVASVSGACSGTGCNGSSQVIKALSISANAAGAVSVYQLKFDVATSGARLTAVSVSVTDQNGNVATSTFGSQATPDSSAPTLTFAGGPVIIPAGTTYTFKVIGTVTPNSGATQWSVNTTLQGDGSTISTIGSSPTYIGTTTTNAIADTNAGLIWSDNATTTAGLNDVDWFNGFQVNGLPAIGL